MHDINTVILDKTGTVTLAEPKVSRVVSIDADERELIEIAASVETRFNHPLARAILSFARQRGITRFKPVSDAEDLPGRGVKARLENREALIGSPKHSMRTGFEYRRSNTAAALSGLPSTARCRGPSSCKT